jgi:hypothetical protein
LARCVQSGRIRFCRGEFVSDGQPREDSPAKRGPAFPNAVDIGCFAGPNRPHRAAQRMSDRNGTRWPRPL